MTQKQEIAIFMISGWCVLIPIYIYLFWEQHKILKRRDEILAERDRIFEKRKRLLEEKLKPWE